MQRRVEGFVFLDLGSGERQQGLNDKFGLGRQTSRREFLQRLDVHMVEILLWSPKWTARTLFKEKPCLRSSPITYNNNSISCSAVLGFRTSQLRVQGLEHGVWNKGGLG